MLLDGIITKYNYNYYGYEWVFAGCVYREFMLKKIALWIS